MCTERGEVKKKSLELMERKRLKDEEFYSIYEVAKLLHKSPNTVRWWIWKGWLKSVKGISQIIPEDASGCPLSFFMPHLLSLNPKSLRLHEDDMIS